MTKFLFHTRPYLPSPNLYTLLLGDDELEKTIYAVAIYISSYLWPVVGGGTLPI